jgi:hypothetical protein
MARAKGAQMFTQIWCKFSSANYRFVVYEQVVAPEGYTFVIPLDNCLHICSLLPPLSLGLTF